MNKRAILEKIITQLHSELDLLTHSARATHAEATDDENKAEDKYDTRGLEASYLAHGQSKAAQEAAEALSQFQSLPIRDFAPSERISLGALVSIDSEKKTLHYFIGPRSGGTEIIHEQASIIVVTPQSPLGRQIVGHTQGETLKLQLTGRPTTALIARVQ